MGALSGKYARIKEEREVEISKAIREREAVAQQRMKEALVDFLKKVHGKPAREYWCMVVGERTSSRLPMLRLGTSCEHSYRDIYFCASEEKFYRPDIFCGGKKVPIGVCEMSEEQVASLLLTEHCFQYLDHYYGEEQAWKGRDAAIPA